MATDIDQPKVWNSESGSFDNPQTTSLATVTENNAVAVMPEYTVAEQREIINTEAPEEYKELLHALVDVSQMSNVLDVVDNDQNRQTRRRFLDMITEGFIKKRLETNAKMESMKLDLINRVWENLDEVDIQTSFDMLTKLHEITSMDAAKPLGAYSDPTMSGAMGGIGGQPTVNLTVNNATAEGSSITTNSLNVNSKPPVEDMKTLSKLNNVVGSWGNIPKKVNPNDEPITRVQDVESSEVPF